MFLRKFLWYFLYLCWDEPNNWQFNKNFVCLPRLENIVYRWMIGVPFQTVSNTHWLCTCIDRGSEPCFAA